MIFSVFQVMVETTWAWFKPLMLESGSSERYVSPADIPQITVQRTYYGIFWLAVKHPWATECHSWYIKKVLISCSLSLWARNGWISISWAQVHYWPLTIYFWYCITSKLYCLWWTTCQCSNMESDQRFQTCNRWITERSCDVLVSKVKPKIIRSQNRSWIVSTSESCDALFLKQVTIITASSSIVRKRLRHGVTICSSKLRLIWSSLMTSIVSLRH